MLRILHLITRLRRVLPLKGKHLPNGYSRGAQSKFCEMKLRGIEQNRGAERRWDLVGSLNSFPYANVTFSIKGYW